MEKLFYSIGEVSKLLGENVTTIRYWSNYFSRWLKPSRGTRGDRKFTPEDIETLRFVRSAIRTEGLRLEGVVERLRNRKVKDPRREVILRLEEIERALEEIKANL